MRVRVSVKAKAHTPDFSGAGIRADVEARRWHRGGIDDGSVIQDFITRDGLIRIRVNKCKVSHSLTGMGVEVGVGEGVGLSDGDELEKISKTLEDE